MAEVDPKLKPTTFLGLPVKSGAKELGKPGRMTEQVMLLYGGCFIVYASLRKQIRA